MRYNVLINSTLSLSYFLFLIDFCIFILFRSKTNFQIGQGKCISCSCIANSSCRYQHL